MEGRREQRQRWGRDFDPDELARLETRMWKAYYRRQPARLFVLLVQALRAQAGLSWPRAIGVSLLLTRAAAGFARSTGDYERFAPDIGRAYRAMHLPATRRRRRRRPPRAPLVGRPPRDRARRRRGRRRIRSPTSTRPVRPAPRVGRRGRPAARPSRRDPRPRRDQRSGRPARRRTGLLAGGRPAAARFLPESRSGPWIRRRAAPESAPVCGPALHVPAHLLRGPAVFHAAPPPTPVLALVEEQEPARRRQAFTRSSGPAVRRFDRRLDDRARADRDEAPVACPAPPISGVAGHEFGTAQDVGRGIPQARSCGLRRGFAGGDRPEQLIDDLA